MNTRSSDFKLFGRIVTSFLAIAMVIGLQSCEQHVITYPEVGYESYSTSIQPIFNNDCVGCHSGSLDPNLSEGASFVSLTSNGYVDTDDPENSLLYTKLQGSHSSYTSAANKELILEWISAGAPND